MIEATVRQDYAISGPVADRPAALGVRDLIEGMANWRLWSMLGWNDIRQRYRRSALGPFWITISMAIFVVLLGVIYSKLFHQDVAVFLPYVAMGPIAWGFIAGTTTEACGRFIENAGIIRQIHLPFTIYTMRMIWRSFIVFLHTVVLIVPIAVLFRPEIGKRFVMCAAPHPAASLALRASAVTLPPTVRDARSAVASQLFGKSHC